MTKQSVDRGFYYSLKILKTKLDLPENLFDLTSALVTVLDPSGCIVYCNKACRDFSGYSSGELLGKYIWELLYSSSQKKSLQKDFSQLNRGNFPKQQENCWLTKQGETSWIAWTNNSYFNKEGQVEYIVATGININHRKLREVELQNQCNLLQSVIEATPDAVFVKDLQGHFKLVNKPFARLFEKKVEDIIGKHISSIFPPKVCMELKRDDVKIISSGQSETFEENVFIQGEWRTYLTTKAPYRDMEGNILGVAGFAKDVNYLKEIQRQLREANEKLEKRVKERTKELQKANQQLQRYVENSPMAVVEWNRSFCIQVWSPAAEQMFGWQEKEVLDKCLFQWRFFHEEDAKTLENTAKVLLYGKCNSEVNSIRNYTKTGQVIHCEWYHSVLFDENGKFISILSLVLDISERKRAEEVRDRFFNLSMDMLTIANAQGNYLQVNPAVARILGYTPQEFVVQNSIERVHPEDREATLAELQKLLSGIPTLYFENRYLSKNGIYKSLAWTAVAVPREGIIYSVGRDITARKEAEAALEQANIELARSNQELEQFASIASHDLREPMRKVQSFAELLVEGYGDRLDGNAEKYLNYIINGATRMQIMIQDLLTYSRLGRNEIALKPTNLDKVLKQVIEDLSIAIEENNAQIFWQKLPTVLANTSEMIQLFQNLISNGIKFHSQAAPIININAQLQGDKWLISFQDNGIGINPKFAERIFVLFQRLHSRNKYPGTGIGLAVCRKIIEHHGGEIWLESEVGKGTTFYFTLPTT